MSEPIVFVSNQRINSGKLDYYKQLYRHSVKLIEKNKPGPVAHLAYVNDEGTEASILHMIPDTESMEMHMVGVDELAKKAFEFMEIVSFEIYVRHNFTDPRRKEMT